MVHLRADFEPRNQQCELDVDAQPAQANYITGALTNAMLPAITGRPGEPRLWARNSPSAVEIVRNLVLRCWLNKGIIQPALSPLTLSPRSLA